MPWLKGMGMECALDDFGTGYSSLTFLKQLTAHTLKIDQSFVCGMLDDAENANIINTVLGLARNFERRALAEDVETEAHGYALIEFGCQFGQGYAIGRPMPADRVPGWLAQWRVPQSWANSQPVSPRSIPFLLAEVEHHAWLKQIHTYALQPAPQALPSDSQNCRFGRWLNKPGTRMRLQNMPEFDPLHTLHQALHDRASALLGSPGKCHADQIAQELGNLAILSQNLLATLRQLRTTQSAAERGNSAFVEL